MRLDLGPLDRLPVERPFVVRGEFEAMTVGGEPIDFTDPVTVRGRVQRVRGGARVVGEVEAPVRLRCGRCLDRFLTTMTGSLDLLLQAPGPPAEDESVPYQEQLDLAPAVEEAVVLELPVRALCRPDCEGLCPRCGTPRREGCSCEPEPDPRLGALADWMRAHAGAEGENR